MINTLITCCITYKLKKSLKFFIKKLDSSMFFYQKVLVYIFKKKLIYPKKVSIVFLNVNKSKQKKHEVNIKLICYQLCYKVYVLIVCFITQTYVAIKTIE